MYIIPYHCRLLTKPASSRNVRRWAATQIFFCHRSVIILLQVIYYYCIFVFVSFGSDFRLFSPGAHNAYIIHIYTNGGARLRPWRGRWGGSVVRSCEQWGLNTRAHTWVNDEKKIIKRNNNRRTDGRTDVCIDNNSIARNRIFFPPRFETDGSLL